jgi:hypothetical protein
MRGARSLTCLYSEEATNRARDRALICVGGERLMLSKLPEIVEFSSEDTLALILNQCVGPPADGRVIMCLRGQTDLTFKKCRRALGALQRECRY